MVLALAFTLGLITFSSADTVGDKKKLDAGIAKLRAELEDTSQTLAQAFVELARTKAELPGARQTLAAAEAARVVADLHNEAVANALALARANEAKADDALAANARGIAQAKNQVGNLARDDYEQGGVSGLSIALEANSPEDFTDRLIMMDTVMRVRAATLGRLDTMLAEGQVVRAHLVAVRQQVAALKVQAEAALVQATAARQNAAAAKTKLDLLYAAQTRYAATVAAKKASETTRIQHLQARSDVLTRILAARAQAARAAHRNGPGCPIQGSCSGFLSYPVDGPVSSPFGPRFDPIMQVWRLARRYRLRGRLRHAGPRRGGRRRHLDHAGVAVRRLRQPARHRPRPAARGRPDDDLQPPVQLRGHVGDMWTGASSWPTPARPGSPRAVTCTSRPARTEPR